MTPRLYLIASDSPRTHQLRQALVQAGYHVNEDASQTADLILLARNIDAFTRTGQAPLLVWLEQPGDVAAVLHNGPDDCVAATASLSEVLARVAALLRRAGQEPLGPVLSFGSVRVDLRRSSADLGKGPVALTPKELHLFSYLACHAGAVVARDELLREVWGYSVAETRTVDTHMAALRRKVEPDPRRPLHLFTIRGRGYQFRQ